MLIWFFHSNFFSENNIKKKKFLYYSYFGHLVCFHFFKIMFFSFSQNINSIFIQICYQSFLYLFLKFLFTHIFEHKISLFKFVYSCFWQNINIIFSFKLVIKSCINLSFFQKFLLDIDFFCKILILFVDHYN
jgi:hypothetical protein